MDGNPIIVGAIPYTNKENVIKNIYRAAALGADAVELRLDFWKGSRPPSIREEICLIKKYGLKAIVTVRDPEEGGAWNPPWKWNILREASEMDAICDIEVKKIASMQWKSPCTRTIASIHFFRPLKDGDYFQISKLSSLTMKYNLYVFKVAAMINKLSELIKLKESIRHPRAAFMPMGRGTEKMRLISVTMGSFLAYGSLEKETAPGQVNLKSLILQKEALRII